MSSRVETGLAPFLYRTVVFAALISVVLAPFVAVEVPAFGDMLNHLARMHVLAGINRSADLQRFYAINWRPIPYLAMDAIVPLLMHVLPIYMAGKVFVCACLLMPALATTVLHLVVHRRFSLVPAVSLLVCTNYLLALGFLNYLFSCGLAVLLFAAWLATGFWPRWWRAAAFTPLLTLLYLGHAFAALAYCLCVAGSEAARLIRTRPQTWLAGAAELTAAAAQSVPALVLAASLRVGAGYVGALETNYGTLGPKLMALVSPILLLGDGTYVLTAMGALGCLFMLRRHVQLAPSVWPAAAVMAVAAVCMPHVMASTWGMDLRLPIVVAMLLIGAMSLHAVPVWLGRVVLIAFAGLLAVRAADAWTALRQTDQEIAATRGVLAQLPRGSRLLIVSTAGHGTGFERIAISTAWHMPLVAVIDRDAFVPYLFSGLTTVQVRAPYNLSSTPNGLPITIEELTRGASGADAGVDGDGHGARRYFRGWPAKFDFVLIQHADQPLPLLPSVLSPIASVPGLNLYQVRG